MPIENFKTEEEFSNYVSNLDRDEIRAWKTSDWNNLYSSINKLLYDYPDNSIAHSITTIKNSAIRKFNLIFGQNMPEEGRRHPQDFIINNVDSFTKLYSNYKMEPQQSAQIKEVAKKYASYILLKDPELKTDILCMDFTRNLKRNVPLLKKMRNYIYKKNYSFNSLLAALIVPNIEIRKLDNKTNGSYNPNSHTIDVKPFLYDSLKTFSHEIFHSLQEFSPVQKSLTAMNLYAPFMGEEMQTLFINNDQFYCEGKNFSKEQVKQQPKCFRGYSRQPMEYAANLFSYYFCRQIIKEIGPEKFSNRTGRYGANLMNLLKLPVHKIKIYGEKPRKIDYVFTNLDTINQLKLQETNSLYTKGNLEIHDNNATLTIEDNRRNYIQLVGIVYNLAKSQRENPENFLEQALPATNKELKKQLEPVEEKLSQFDYKFKNILNHFSKQK